MGIEYNIRKLREEHGLTQEQLGEIAGVSDKAVSTWETGSNFPRMGAIQKMADYFGISKSALIEDRREFEALPNKEETPPEQIEERYEYAAELLTKLSPANQKIIMKLTPRNVDRLFGYAERLLEEQSSE